METSEERQEIISELITSFVIDITRECTDDSLENNFFLITALKEISGMVPPHPAMDWSVTQSSSLLMETEVSHFQRRESLHEELIKSIVFSTPRNFFCRNEEKDFKCVMCKDTF